MEKINLGITANVRMNFAEREEELRRLNEELDAHSLKVVETADAELRSETVSAPPSPPR